MWPVVFSCACTAAIFFSCATEVALSPVTQTEPKSPPTSLKLGDKIAIVCDHTCVEQAQAIRATLEAFRLQVDFYRLVQRWQTDDFFGKRAKDYEYVVICCHGTTNPKPGIKFEVIKPKKDNPELGDMVEYVINADNVSSRLIGFQGILVSLACESGSQPLAEAFLKAGCKAYLGPSCYSDDSSGLIYAQSFFYFLQYQWRKPSPEKWTIKEAADAAQRLDPRAKYGTSVSQAAQRSIETLPRDERGELLARPEVRSDNGSGYLSKEFRQVLEENRLSHVKIKPSCPEENGLMERSNRTVREAWEQEIPPEDVEAAVKLLKKIKRWYNEERLHSALGYLRPVDYYRGNPEALKEERRVKMAQARHRRKQINLGLKQPTLPLVT